MTYETDTASRYRKRATQLRVIAAYRRGGENARTLMGVALDYEVMAQVFDGIERENLVALRTKNSN